MKNWGFTRENQLTLRNAQCGEWGVGFRHFNNLIFVSLWWDLMGTHTTKQRSTNYMCRNRSLTRLTGGEQQDLMASWENNSFFAWWTTMRFILARIQRKSMMVEHYKKSRNTFILVLNVCCGLAYLISRYHLLSFTLRHAAGMLRMIGCSCKSWCVTRCQSMLGFCKCYVPEKQTLGGPRSKQLYYIYIHIDI